MKKQIIYINFGWIWSSYLNLVTQVGRTFDSLDTKLEYLRNDLGMQGKVMYDAKKLLFLQELIETSCKEGAGFIENSDQEPWEFFYNCMKGAPKASGDVLPDETELLLIDHYHNIAHTKEDIVDINQEVATEENWVGCLLFSGLVSRVRWVKSLNSSFVDPNLSKELPFDLGLKFHTLMNYTEDMAKLVESPKFVYLAFTPDCTPEQYRHLYTLLKNEGKLLNTLYAQTKPVKLDALDFYGETVCQSTEGGEENV